MDLNRFCNELGARALLNLYAKGSQSKDISESQWVLFLNAKLSLLTNLGGAKA